MIRDCHGDEYDDPAQLAADLDDTPPPGWVLCRCDDGQWEGGARHAVCGGYGWIDPDRVTRAPALHTEREEQR